MKKTRLEMESAIIEFFKNAKPETQQRLFENMLFSLSNDRLTEIHEAEVA